MVVAAETIINLVPTLTMVKHKKGKRLTSLPKYKYQKFLTNILEAIKWLVQCNPIKTMPRSIDKIIKTDNIEASILFSL